MYTPPHVKTFTSVTKRLQTPDGRSTVVKPDKSLDDTINDWIDQNSAVVLSTAVSSFSLAETKLGTQDVVRRTVTVSQVVFMPEEEYLEREARIRSMSMSSGADVAKPEEPVAVSESEEAAQMADSDPGGIPDMPINTNDEEFEL